MLHANKETLKASISGFAGWNIFIAKPPIWVFLEGLGMEHFDTFYHQ
jgi:hypothetical protein